MSNNTLGWIFLGLFVLGATFWIVRELLAPDNAMSAGGWIALAVGVIGTAAMGGILMWLLFRSDRSGYDR